jgi:hypothetical protein
MCKICNTASDPFDTATVLGKYRVNYFRCPECGLIETETPYWLSESYSDAIASSDIGLVGRNVDLAELTSVILSVFFDGSGKFVDYGGGYGLFVRLMRDAGFDFYRYDKHCANLFATGFDVCLEPSQKFELVTAFEVFEHLVDPITEVAKMSSITPSILFTTELIPESDPPHPDHWWYYGLHHGQHITFYTHRSLSVLAKRTESNLYSSGSFHLLTRKKISARVFNFIASSRGTRWAKLVLPKRRSLLGDDYFRLTGFR